MKTVLFDTNIIIERENPKTPNESVARLFYCVDKEKLEKFIHPSCFVEIGKFYDKKQVEIIKAKLAAYSIINILPSVDEKFFNLIKILTNNENDYIDNELLYQVYDKRIALLITEDKKMLQKANILFIRSKVLTIDEYLLMYRNSHPELVKYKVLGIQEKFFNEININDSFFNFFKENYIGFEDWYKKKAVMQEKAYVVFNKSSIEGFLYLKVEYENEVYGDFDKQFIPKKRLKIGTFKIISGGYRLGERFIKIIVDNAINSNIDEIYVTIFDKIESVKPLVDLLESWGFENYCMNTKTGESVMIKRINEYDENHSPKFNYPLVKQYVRKYFLPIEQIYHSDLFPDSALQRELVVDKKQPYQYALQKTYVTFSFTAKNAKRGDIVLIYRKGVENRAKYTGVVTTTCVIDKIVRISTLNQLLSECENRSVFEKINLETFFITKNIIYVVKLIHHRSLDRKITLKKLWDNGFVEQGKGPRSFDPISDDVYEKLMEMGKVKD
jgi:predicted nucleic acid-binding protein